MIVDFCLYLNQGKMEMKEASQSQPQSQPGHEISQDFPSLSAFLSSCDCSKWETVLEKEEITLKRLPNFREQDFKDMGISLGAARELDLALMKYRLNHHDSHENKVYVDCIHFVNRTN